MHATCLQLNQKKSTFAHDSSGKRGYGTNSFCCATMAMRFQYKSNPLVEYFFDVLIVGVHRLDRVRDLLLIVGRKRRIQCVQ